ncbi:MAG: MarR family transcriptional regulator [Syntrophotaleaceae bacterium]
MVRPTRETGNSTVREPGEGLDGLNPQEPDILADLTETPAVPAGSYELRVLQSLRRIIRAVEIHSESWSDHQITGPQLGCLAAVKESGPLTTTKLAQAIYLSPSTIVGIIDRLAEKGLVVRQRSSKDRRQVQVCPTAAGEQLLDRASALQDTFAAALKGLPELGRYHHLGPGKNRRPRRAGKIDNFSDP